jgi:nucleotide-binding universal stress UspA family protein
MARVCRRRTPATIASCRSQQESPRTIINSKASAHCPKTNGRYPMYQNILLAYDGSPDGREALAQAKSLASISGSTVHLLAIIDPSENMAIVEGMSPVLEQQHHERMLAQSALDAAVKRLRGGCTVTSDIRYGNPAEQIVLSAREMNADLIVVGHRDQGRLARWLSRSVGESILHHPPCSVLVAIKSEQKVGSPASVQKSMVREDG